MAFTEVVGLDCDNTTALGGLNKKTGKPNPTKAEGYYLGSRDVESKKSRSGFAKLHILQTANGNQGIWGKTDLDRKLSSVVAGTMIRITQNGKQPTPNGEMYKYKVEIDRDNVIEVASNNNESSASPSEDATGEYESSEESFEDAEEVLDEVTPPRPSRPVRAAAAPDAARQAKVQALLNGSKKF